MVPFRLHFQLFKCCSLAFTQVSFHIYFNTREPYKLYLSDAAEDFESQTQSTIVQSNPDSLVQTLEKVSAIFDRIKRGNPYEVEIICTVLPDVLNDFFPPSDILTKVLGEFLSPQQPHPRLLSGVVFKVRAV